MYQTSLQPATQANVFTFQRQGVLTHVTLNYHEVMCIEIALTGFAEKIRNKDLPTVFKGYRVDRLKAQLRYLQNWFDQPDLRAQLRLDGRNSVHWPFTSSELVNWLLPVCQSCIDEDAVLIVAADAACCEYADYADTYLYHENSHSLIDHMEYVSFSSFRDHYSDLVATYQAVLVRKLAAIQSQRYPLFPTFSLTH